MPYSTYVPQQNPQSIPWKRWLPTASAEKTHSLLAAKWSLEKILPASLQGVWSELTKLQKIVNTGDFTLIINFTGDNAETSTLVYLDIDRQKGSQLIVFSS